MGKTTSFGLYQCPIKGVSESFITSPTIIFFFFFFENPSIDNRQVMKQQSNL